jgi:hypothetical protein
MLKVMRRSEVLHGRVLLLWADGVLSVAGHKMLLIKR